MVTLYNVVSADGFVARADGGEDFIPDELWDYFIELCGKYDSLVIGRKTYEAIQKYDEGSLKKFEELMIKKVVVTRDEAFMPKHGYVVVGSPREALSREGNVLLVSGATLNTAASKEGLIDKVIVNVLPIEVGGGIKQFEVDPELSLLSVEQFSDGRILKIYKVVK